MSITFDCTTCGRKLKVKEELAGQQVRCPECGAIQQVPEPVLDTEASPAFHATEEVGYSLAPPEPKTDSVEKRRPCPMCGEMILVDAVKCRFCGEIFDETLKRAESKKHIKPSDADLGVAEYLLAILCSSIGCIVGIVYMIQGKPKGTKMLLISLVCSIFWFLINVAITSTHR